MTDPTSENLNQGQFDRGQAIGTTRARLRWSWAIGTCLSVVAAGGLASAYSIHRFGTIGHAIDHANGMNLAIDHRSKDLGDCMPGQRVAVSFPLTNLSDQTIRIIGSRVDCSCIAADDRPFDIKPRDTKSYDLEIEMPLTPGPVERLVVLFSDVPTQRQIDLKISGIVSGVAASASRTH